MTPNSSPDPSDLLRIVETIGPKMAHEEFLSVYDSVLAASPDHDVLSRLLWAAGMYLDRNPHLIELPRSLAEEFLASDDFDDLLAGLMVIRHSTASPSEIARAFLAVMQREAWDERSAALCHLCQWFRSDGLSVASAIPEPVLEELQSVLAQIEACAPNEVDREMAARYGLAIKRTRRA